jgi:hypothetical protein
VYHRHLAPRSARTASWNTPTTCCSPCSAGTLGAHHRPTREPRGIVHLAGPTQRILGPMQSGRGTASSRCRGAAGAFGIGLCLLVPPSTATATGAREPFRVTEAALYCGKVETRASYSDQFALMHLRAAHTSCRTAVRVGYATIERFCPSGTNCEGPTGAWTVLGWRCRAVLSNYTISCFRGSGRISAEFEVPGGG